MKRAFHWLAGLVLAAGIILWIAGGRQTAVWTKTFVQIDQVDPVTELHYPKVVKGFYPGIDWLVATGLVGAVLAFGSCFISKKTSH